MCSAPCPITPVSAHPDDPAWISRQVSWLGAHLGLRGTAEKQTRIWPIVQLSDWGETVSAAQVAEVLDQGTRLPATGVLVFAWGSLRDQPEKVEAMGRFYRAIDPGEPARRDAPPGEPQDVGSTIHLFR